MPFHPDELITSAKVTPEQFEQAGTTRDPETGVEQFNVEGLSGRRQGAIEEFARRAQGELNTQIFNLLGKQKTVENVRQVEAIHKQYRDLQNFIRTGDMQSNADAIDAFVKSETQRIKLFGGDEDGELSSYVNSLATTARKFNLNLGIEQNEQEAWSTITQLKLDLDVMAKKEDHEGVSQQFDKIKSLMRRYISEDIIDEKRAGYYLKGMERKLAEATISAGDDRLNLIIQTEGYESASNYVDKINNLYGDKFKELPEDVQANWIRKQKSIKFLENDIQASSDSYGNVRDNFLNGISNYQAFSQVANNYIKNINKALPNANQRNKRILQQNKDAVIGQIVATKAISNELQDVFNGVKSEFQLLNPSATPMEISKYQDELFKNSPNKSEGAKASFFEIRNELLRKYTAGRKDDIHGSYNTLINGLRDQFGVKSPLKFFKTPREGPSGVFDKIENDIVLGQMFGHPISVSKDSIEDLKRAVQSPQDQATSAIIRQGLSKLKKDRDLDLSDLVMKFDAKNKARDIENPNFVSFIGTYGLMMPNISNPKGFTQAESFLRNNNTDFSKSVGAILKTVGSDADILDHLQKLSKFSGYDLSTILNAVSVDTALGVVNGQYGVGPDALKLLVNNEDSGIREPLLENISERLEQFSEKIDFAGRSILLKGETNMFQSQNKLDRAILGVFDKPVTETGFFERTAENIGQFAGLKVIKNLIPHQQKRVEKFLSNFLPEHADLSGRLRIFPATNGFYNLAFDNGFGGVEPIMTDGNPLVINPVLYKKMSQDFSDIDMREDENHETVATFLIDLITMSNQLPRNKKLDNL